MSFFKSHGRIFDKLIKKGILSFNTLNEEYLIFKQLVNDIN